VARRRKEKEHELCGVLKCNKEASRSISTSRLKAALPDLKLEGEGRRTHLCKEHYKLFRKKTKTDRKLERLGW